MLLPSIRKNYRYSVYKTSLRKFGDILSIILKIETEQMIQQIFDLKCLEF